MRLRFPDLLWPFGVFAAAIAVDCALGPSPIDDAYITLRYVRSLVEGQGFVYNAGEHVLGTTTPLFALLIAALQLITHADIVHIAFVVAVAAHAAAAVLVGIFGMRCGRPIAGWVAAMGFALAPLAVDLSASCMESSLFVLLILWVTMPRDFGVPRAASIAAGLAMLVRPEGILIAAAHFARVLRHARPRFWREVAIVAFIVLPWLGFATSYFGSPLPHSMHAKWQVERRWTLTAQGMWNAMVSVPLGMDYLSLVPLHNHPRLKLGFWEVKLPAIPYDMLLKSLLAGSAMLGLAVCGAWQLWRTRKGLWLIWFTLAYVLAYLVGAPFFFPWYALPLFPALFVCLAIGSDHLLRLVSRNQQTRTLAAVSLSCGAILVVTMHTIARVRAEVPEREAHYRQAIEWLGAIAQAPAYQIAAVEVGTPGYFSRARMLDLCGLVSPELDHAASAIAVVEQLRPAVVITAPLTLLETATSVAFKRDYHLGLIIPHRSSAFLATSVFVRNDVVIPPHDARAD